MTENLILASGSQVRRQMLESAGVLFRTLPARVDEDALRAALEAEATQPRDIADAMAEAKARKIGEKNPDSMVIGCDQVLAFENGILSKPTSPDDARTHLQALCGKRHDLLSAVVIYEAGKPVWRHVGEVRMTMRNFSESYLDSYLDRNWESVRHAVGAYKLEEEGVRLFTQVDGDYFTVLGLPLLDLLAYLTLRGVIEK